MHLPYCLECSVCGNSFEGRKEWLQHLKKSQHQRKARMECREKWRLDKEFQNRVVVIFCGFSLKEKTNCNQLLEKFSGGRGDQLVTDFVWWPERERVCYLQFESRERVEEILAASEDGTKALIGNRLVQLKKIVDLPELEWEVLIPTNQSDVCMERSPSVTGALERSATLIVPDHTQFVPESSCIPNPETPLQLQYNAICKSVEIPMSDYQYAMEVTSHVKQAFSELHPSDEAQVQVVVYRNYYLGLRNTSSSVLLLFAYITDESEKGFQTSGKTDEFSALQSATGMRLLPGFKQVIPEPTVHSTYGNGTLYKHNSTGFQFSLSTHPLTLPEAQLDHLVCYLCTFDPRVKPLLTLVYFWAHSNHVRIAEQEESIHKSRFHSNVSEPVALEWLVMLFLIHGGLLPSVRQIIQRPHKTMLLTGKNIDLGFAADPQYAREWAHSRTTPVPRKGSTEFVISVVALLQNLFEFYSSQLEEGCWLLNPMDGEIIKREGTHCHKSSLDSEEMRALNVTQQKASGSDKHLIISRHRIYMLHPLHITSRLSFCVETWTEFTCMKMRNAAGRLDKFLKAVSEDGTGNVFSLEVVLTDGLSEAETGSRKRKGKQVCNQSSQSSSSSKKARV